MMTHTCGNVAKSDLLCCSSRQSHADRVQDLLLCAQEDLLGQVLSEAKSAVAARDNGHLRVCMYMMIRDVNTGF